MGPGSSQGAGRIFSLDGLRGIAILLVLTHHASPLIAPHAPEAVHRWLAAYGRIGVQLFFAVSGYLITGLLIREREKTGRISLPRFYVRRCLRIVPAFAVFLATVAVVSEAGLIDVGRRQLLAAATYTWNYPVLWGDSSGSDSSWYLGHMWTLSLEEQFYLLWPALVVFTPRRYLAGLIIAVVATMPAVRILTYFEFPDQRGALGMMFHTASDAVWVGCLLAILSDAGRRAICLRHSLSIAAGAALAVLAGIQPALDIGLRGYGPSVGFTVTALCCGAIVLWAATGESAGGMSLLRSPLLVRIGVLSYSLYLWQQFFLSPGWATPVVNVPIPLRFLMIGAAAWASYRFVERQFLAIKDRFATRRAKRLSPEKADTVVVIEAAAEAVR